MSAVVALISHPGWKSICVLAGLLLTAGLVVSGCIGGRGTPASNAVIGEAGVLDGHTLQSDIDSGPLTLEQIVDRGKHLFTASFNTLDGAGRPDTTDVSPNNFRPTRHFPDNFNRISGPDANSCGSCHTIPRLGGGGDNATNVFVLADRLHFVNFDADEGDGFQPQTLKTVGNERTSLGLFGSGYVELLAREMSQDLQNIRSRAIRTARDSGSPVEAALITKGVDFGRIVARPDGTMDTGGIDGVSSDLIIRPFMQKGTIVSLREFAVKAMNQHFGMQASERFGNAIDHDGDGIPDELSRGDITALVLFQATLPAPGSVVPRDNEARKAAERGRTLFTDIGCVSCHIPALPLYSSTFSEPNPFNPSGKLQVFEVENPFDVDLASLGDGAGFSQATDGALMVPVFTDLKRHNMGDRLDNETLEEESVPTDEWLTRKLWGFASEPPFLHHGRATLVSEAVLAHGGDAQPSRDAFAGLPDNDRAAVIEFLKTLQIPDDSADASSKFTLPIGWNSSLVLTGVGALGGAVATLLGCLIFLRLRSPSRSDQP